METVCDTCGKAFDDFASNKRRFCGRPCYWKWLATQKPWNLGKVYHHSEAARRRKSGVMKRLYVEGKRKPAKRQPQLIVSEQEVALLKELYVEQHQSAGEIAARFKTTDTTVRRRLHGFNILAQPVKRKVPVDRVRHAKGEAPIQNTDPWVFGVPCFTCQVRSRCSLNSVGLPSPVDCEPLSRWLLEQKA